MTHRTKLTTLAVLLTTVATWARSADTTTVTVLPPTAGTPTVTATRSSHYGYAAYVNPGRLIATDEYVSRWLTERSTTGVGLEVTYMSLPRDSFAYARDFGYPTFAFGIRYSYNGDVRMHRSGNWGQAREVDYDSHLGNMVSLYASFNRPLLRTRHWEADYTLGLGLGYTSLVYNKEDDIDNELIGARLNCYFNAGFHLTYHVVTDWGIKVGVDFVHHSNGALDRPNKGSNALGPTVGVVYSPYYAEVVDNRSAVGRRPFRPFWYVDITAGVGGKSLDEDWQLTQFQTAEDDTDYRTEHFHLYANYSLQAAVMRRYARRWASGVGLEATYGSCYRRVREIERSSGSDKQISPWSAAVTARHEVFYGRWSAPMALGWYVFRRMGSRAEQVDKPYYERVGVKYNLPIGGGRRSDVYDGQWVAVGVSLCAHALKASFTELTVSVPVMW